MLTLVEETSFSLPAVSRDTVSRRPAKFDALQLRPAGAETMNVNTVEVLLCHSHELVLQS